MSIRIFDTRQQQKVELVPLEPGKLGFYLCGVTVYDFSHLGHARCYVAFDAILRYLRFAGYDVKVVRNYTDVDDKIIKRAAERGESIEALTERFIQAYVEDMEALDVARADVEPRVTGHLPEIVAMVEALIARGHAYESEGDVYFAVESYPDYCGLSGRNLADCMAGASERMDPEELKRKKHPLDFALWKQSEADEPGWESPWGRGRPGWHIECSAMSSKHLGATFDLHGGGQDLVFPHHENEIAQSVCATGEGFARHWLHNGFVNVDSEKMSKSLGNFFTIREIFKLFHPQAVRFFLLSTHYRGPINYSDQHLQEATRRVDHIYCTLQRMDAYLAERAENHKRGPVHDKALVAAIGEELRAAMDDDFNTPRAIAALSEPVRKANELLNGKEVGGRYATIAALREAIAEVAEVLRVFHRDPATTLGEIQALVLQQRGIDPAEIDRLVADRCAARAAKDFSKADALRDDLNARGVQIMDAADRTDWRVVP